MRHLFDAWPEVRGRLRAAPHVLLATDFDGTLLPLVASPDLAELPASSRQLLERLSRLPRYTVAIVSGRSLQDIRDRVALPGLLYAGNHGMEIEGLGHHYTDEAGLRLRETLQALGRRLAEGLAPIDGALVEEKGLSVAVHYRRVKTERQDEVRRAFDEATEAVRRLGQVVVREGKKVYEVRPAGGWDKDRALEFLIETAAKRSGAAAVVPVYLGDDVTDEDGFRAVHRYGGISVVVGLEGRASAARYALRSPGEVDDLLERLLGEEKPGCSRV